MRGPTLRPKLPWRYHCNQISERIETHLWVSKYNGTLGDQCQVVMCNVKAINSKGTLFMDISTKHHVAQSVNRNNHVHPRPSPCWCKRWSSSSTSRLACTTSTTGNADHVETTLALWLTINMLLVLIAVYRCPTARCGGEVVCTRPTSIGCWMGLGSNDEMGEMISAHHQPAKNSWQMAALSQIAMLTALFEMDNRVNQGELLWSSGESSCNSDWGGCKNGHKLVCQNYAGAPETKGVKIFGSWGWTKTHNLGLPLSPNLGYPVDSKHGAKWYKRQHCVALDFWFCHGNELLQPFEGAGWQPSWIKRALQDHCVEPLSLYTYPN